MPSAVHPHVRGADVRNHDGNEKRAVHPHVRGADVSFRFTRIACSRFIPTCVGQTTLPTGITVSGIGSSPRAWGRPAHGLGRAGGRRFIPTCVGQTGQSQAVGLCMSRFIPTCVGQTGRSSPSSSNHSGSSPRAWGRRYAADRMVNDVAVHPHVRGADSGFERDVIPSRRFIPTCVGQTSRWATNHLVQSVHPHVRGADPVPRDFSKARDGSSPRAWGRRTGHRYRAAAGPVHPHVRGADCLTSLIRNP